MAVKTVGVLERVKAEDLKPGALIYFSDGEGLALGIVGGIDDEGFWFVLKLVGGTSGKGHVAQAYEPVNHSHRATYLVESYELRADLTSLTAAGHDAPYGALILSEGGPCIRVPYSERGVDRLFFFLDDGRTLKQHINLAPFYKRWSIVVPAGGDTETTLFTCNAG